MRTAYGGPPTVLAGPCDAGLVRTRGCRGLAGAVALLAVLGLSACGHAAEPDVSLEGRWRLERLVDAGDETVFAKVSRPPVLTYILDYQALSGCQVIEWKTHTDGEDVRFTDMSVGSMMSCPVNFVDLLDGTYPDLLRRVDHARRGDRTLVLSGDDLEMTFVPLDSRDTVLD
ncbi:hypothetical protein NLS1_13570 [Nocardioides sp. LS1]|nr:hypothetical protein NLS1_13570 [Nocardioides sp. LS1]